MEKFIELMAEILEVETNEVKMEMDYRTEIEDWDSLKGFSIICMLEDEYNVQMDVPTFLKCITVGDLYRSTLKE